MFALLFYLFPFLLVFAFVGLVFLVWFFVFVGLRKIFCTYIVVDLVPKLCPLVLWLFGSDFCVLLVS